jgi:hypothetical protein
MGLLAMVWGEEGKPGPRKFPWGLLVLGIALMILLYFVRP